MPRMPSVGQLRELMTTMYPEDDSDSDHPTTAVGIVLLPASIFGLTEEDALVRFTGYPRPFIAAILFNLRGNRVLDNGSYDCNDWLSSDGAITEQGLWNHIEAHAATFGSKRLISIRSIVVRSTGTTGNCPDRELVRACAS